MTETPNANIAVLPLEQRLAEAPVDSVPLYTGSPAERGRTLMEQHREHYAGLQAAGDGVAKALASPDTRRGMDTALGLLTDHFPAAVEFVQSSAETAGVPPELLLAESFRMYLKPTTGTPVADPKAVDECSVGAGVLSSGAWVVKNRDTGSDVAPRHIVTQHRDPAWGGRTVLGQSTVGGPMATSAGINSDGLCIVSTSGPVPAGAAPGVLRTFMLGELLAQCTSVAQALAIIEPLRHLGGTFTLGDAGGDIASVDLHPDGIVVERPGPRQWLARTNHYTDPSHANAHPDGPPANSVGRLATMCAVLPGMAEPGPSWPERELSIARRMTEHGQAGVCRHEGKVTTVATSIFTTSPPAMVSSVGNGCTGEWVRWAAG